MKTRRLCDIVGTSVTREAERDDLGICADALLDTRDGRVVGLLLELDRPGGLMQAIVAPHRFAMDEQVLMVDVSDAELDAQGANQDPSAAPVVDPAPMPPIFVGPFGFTISPAMATALVNSTMARWTRPMWEPPTIDQQEKAWHWFSNLNGLPVFEGTRELGEMSDVTVDEDMTTCRELLVFDKPKGTRGLPFAAIRNVDRRESHVIVERREKPPYSVEAIVESLGSPDR